MRIAVVHALPLEYYPPARNMIELLAGRAHWKVKAWSSVNRRGIADWSTGGVRIRRHWSALPDNALPVRIAGYGVWHARTAMSLLKWRPDAIISVEPHSALAVWLYYRLLRKESALLIHHHEYYSPDDFSASGMRVLRATRDLERTDLFSRAIWVSQTNDQRLRLLLGENDFINRNAARSLPNYPPLRWVKSAERIGRRESSQTLRMVYVGAASFEDTFIREAVLWAASHPDTVTLHVCGDNIQPEVADWIRSMNSRAITLNEQGADYGQLPHLLRQFDVGLVLYRGNTLNFIHNVPNKTIEYLACGLQVWYPGVMQGMVQFHQLHPDENLREMNFGSLPSVAPSVMPRDRVGEFPFTAERALDPMVSVLEAIEANAT